MRRNDAEIFALRRSGVRGMKESSAECPGRRSQSAKSSAGVGYRFAMGKASAGRGMKKSSAEYPGRRSQSAKSSAGVGYRFAMGKPSAGRGMKDRP